jgi:hypothetical protein
MGDYMETVKNGKGSKNRTKNKAQFDANYCIINWNKRNNNGNNGNTKPTNSKTSISKSSGEPQR